MSQPEIPDNTPIIVGAGQKTYHDPENISRTPIQAMLDACELAFEDSGQAVALRNAVDAIVTGKKGQEDVFASIPNITPKYPALALRKSWGLPDAAVYKGANGGSSIQSLINYFAEKLVLGEHGVVVITAAELFRTIQTTMRAGRPIDRDLAHWGECPQGECAEPWKKKDIWGSRDSEHLYGLLAPTHFYPLIENAQRYAAGRSIEEHQLSIASLFHRLSKIAATNPYASVRKERSVEEIMNAPYIAFPHTTKMVALINVDMTGAVILTTAGRARALGIAQEKWIFLNGCADLDDKWYLTDRVNFTASDAARIAGEAALGMAEISVDDLDLIDIYSCFPCAVMATANALNIDTAKHDVSIAGGLPYFGGPANSYPLHPICTMVEKLREQPGANAMITGNSWYLTKESFGIYSTRSKGGAWQRPSQAAMQAQIDAIEYPTVIDVAEGNATVETYTVLFGKNGPETGIIVGRLENDARFLANTASDAGILNDMITREAIGRHGTVRPENGKNIFTFA